jgi:putative tricarboxylic transport membrane protein
MEKNRIAGLFWLVLGVFFSIWSTSYEIGSPLQPGTGFYPFILGLLLILLSIILLLGQRKRSQEEMSTSLQFSGRKKIVYIILILTFAGLFFEKIGYLLTFFLLIFLLMIGTTSRSWKQIFLIAFFSVAAIYIVFVLLLKQPLPLGLIGF